MQQVFSFLTLLLFVAPVLFAFAYWLLKYIYQHKDVALCNKLCLLLGTYRHARGHIKATELIVSKLGTYGIPGHIKRAALLHELTARYPAVSKPWINLILEIAVILEKKPSVAAKKQE